MVCGQSEGDRIVERKKTVRDSLPVIFMGANGYLKNGLESMLSCSFRPYSDFNKYFRGLLLLAPQSCTTELRMNMLCMTRLISNSPGWKGIVFADENDVSSKKFSIITGLPIVDLSANIKVMRKAIIDVMNKKQRVSTRSVGKLTDYQWGAMISSLGGNVIPGIEDTKKLYSYRASALNRINIKNIHQLRVLLSGGMLR